MLRVLTPIHFLPISFIQLLAIHSLLARFGGL